MPRGSKPGERRGGRQLGTPNKKTVLRKAAFAAAAANPHSSPIDFLLNLMRDETTPPDLRLQIAQTAAPYLHDKPGGADASRRPKPINGMAVVSFNGTTRLRARARAGACGNGAVKPQGQAVQAVPEGAYSDLSPLEVMLELMNDPEVPASLRVKAARAMVPFTRPKRKPVPRPDPEGRTYLEGLIIDPELAAAFRDDSSRHAELHNKGVKSESGGPQLTPAEIEERAELEARIEQRTRSIELPAEYGLREFAKDEERLRRIGIKARSSGRVWTEAEEIEVMQMNVRMSAYRAGPEPAARSRARALRSKRHECKEGLSPAETSELEAIEARYPGIPAEEFPLRIPSAGFIRAFDVAQGRPPREVLV